MASTTSSPRGGVPAQVPTNSKLFSNIKYLYTGDPELGEIPDAAIQITANKIVWVGSMQDWLNANNTVNGNNNNNEDSTPTLLEVIDCTGCLITPGLINTHHHLFQSLTKGINSENELFSWLQGNYKVWQNITPDEFYISTKVTLEEMVLTGCTLTTDHAYTYPNGCLLDDEIRAAREVGIRFQPVRGAMSMGESKGGLPPDSMVEDEHDILKDMERLINEFHDPNDGAMLRIALGPCAPFTVTRDLMIKTAALARKYPKVRLHTHLAENFKDIEYHDKVLKQSPGDYIQELGWAKDDCWFAHCVMLTDDEIKLFAELGLGLAHCPSSNFRLASGIAPIQKCLEHNVAVGLGLDGNASNDSSNLIGEARLALLAARVRDFRPKASRDDPATIVPGNPAALSTRDALKIATVGGARCLGRENELGRIKPGYIADIVAWPLETAIEFAGAQNDPVNGLLLSAAWGAKCKYSVVNGNLIVNDGVLVNVDVDQDIKDMNAASKKLHDLAAQIAKS